MCELVVIREVCVGVNIPAALRQPRSQESDFGLDNNKSFAACGSQRLADRELQLVAEDWVEEWKE